MKLIKKLLSLAVLAGLALTALAAWQSPYFALFQIDRGLRARDVARVERYADLGELVKASAQVVAALAAEQAGVGGEDLGSRVLGSLIGAVAAQLGDAAAPSGAAELRRAVLDGRVTRALGPFTINDGFGALGPLQQRGERAVVELEGRCGGNPARLGLVFAKDDDPMLGLEVGWPKKWVLIGVDQDSVKVLAKSCRAQ